MPSKPNVRDETRTTDDVRDRGSAKWIWGAAAVAIATLALWLWHASDEIVGSAVGASVRILGTNLAVTVGIGVVVWLLLRFVVRRFIAIPSGFIAVVVGSLATLLTLSAGTSRLAWWALVLITVITAATIGVSAWSLTHSGRHARTTIAAAVAILVLAGTFVWLLVPTGTPPAALKQAEPTAELSIDPSERGDLKVNTLTYGSGDDKLREEYGAGADVKTKSVDLSKVIPGWTKGSERTEQWGFDAGAIPLNAQVWYPDGPGPYPLVLIVHGNKSSVEFSESGYAYLAEHLASHGLIAASIDENFLNTTLLDRSSNIGDTSAARAILPLEHLKAWQQIASGDSPLAGKVDMQQIALVGHSRGGEAVAVAAMLNKEPVLPGHDDVPLDYGFEIRSVAALAPADGQFDNGGEKVQLSDVSYLAVQGSHDVDVSSFGGLNQLARTTLGADDIGATVYIGGADHSQFNSSWGRRDIGNGATKYFIDTGALISPSQQQKITKAAVWSFLGTTLAGDDQRAFFEGNRGGQFDGALYLTSLRSGSSTVLLDGQEDETKETGSGGAAVEGTDLQTWNEIAQPLRAGPGDNRIVELKGNGGRLTITPAAPIAVPAGGSIQLDLATADGTDLTSVSLEITDAAGQKAVVEVSDIPPPIVGAALKAAWMQSGAMSEPVLQTRVVPASAITGSGTIDLAAITSVAIVLDADADRTVLLDNVLVG